LDSITKKTFKDWIVSSNGKAIRWIQEHGDEGVEGLIIAACIKNLIDTSNLFDSPAWYQAELIESCVDPHNYIKRVLASYSHRRSPERCHPLANLIEELVRRGHADCKRFIQKHWRGELDRGNASLACSSLWLWRAPAYRRVLHHIASLTVEKEHLAQLLEQVHSEASCVFGEKTSKRIRSEMESIYPQLAIVIAPEVDRDELIATNPICIRRMNELSANPIFNLKRKTSSQEIEQVELVRSQNWSLADALQWLGEYTYKPFDGKIESLLIWLNVKGTRQLALEALGQVRHPLARKAALVWLNSRSYYTYAIKGLQSNLEPGDEGLLLDILKMHCKDNTRHYGFEAAIDVIEANPEGNWAEVLALGLGNVQCNHCRLRYAQALIDRNLLKADQIEDLLLDGWCAIRYTAGRAMGVNPGKYQVRF
jgi:hypothetical protein